jgi:predicted acylesterase/phospholipase RssA/CRP-like cAMP-binding protein
LAEPEWYQDPIFRITKCIVFRLGSEKSDHEGGRVLPSILQGRLSVRLEHADGTATQLTDLEPGTPVGELALLTGQPRTASVYAATDARLMRCSRDSYERLAEQHPDELAGFTRAFTRRMREVQLAGVLANHFGPLDAQTLAWLQQELEWIQLHHGDVLFSEGDPGEAMFLVVSGRLRITTSRPGDSQRVLGEVSPGEVVGELGLLSGEPRTATAVAIRETHAVRMTLPVFERLAECHPHAMMSLMRLIIRREQRSLRVLAQEPSRALGIALVPISHDLPLVPLTEELAGSLGKHGSVLVLDSTRLDRGLGKPGAAQAEADDATGLVVSAWLSEQETRYRYLLYVADRDWSPWTQRCTCQADRLLLVGDAQADPDLAPVEQAIAALSLPVRQELVLLHPETASRPSGTAAWLAGRSLHTHHHLRRGDAAHMRRLARRLAGRALGLVLSGGAARGFAHVGVLQAMEELGIEIDLIGGSSMGSLLGGLYALEVGPLSDLLALAQRYANPKHLFDYTLPLISLMASRKLTWVMQKLYGEARIEDLWRPLFCVSSNMSRGEAVIDRSGMLWEAVRASIAIPGVWSPMLRGSDVLVDGGAMNNFPVDVMARLCEGGPVVGSNVCPLWERPGSYDFGPSISGWRVLWSRMNPFTPAVKAPSLLGSLMRAQEIRGVPAMRHAEDLAAVLVRPDVSAFAVLDFAAFEPIIEIGYQAARKELAAWRDAP